MQMQRVLAVAIGLVALFIFDGGEALADGTTGVSVQPLTPKPGEVITVKGDLLGENSRVEVRLIGAGVDLDLGEVQADGEGDFTAQFRVPDDLKPGNYQVKAIGAKTATTAITVVGGASAESASMEQPAPVLRVRSLPESVGLIALFGALAGLGIFFARTTQQHPSAR